MGDGGHREGDCYKGALKGVIERLLGEDGQCRGGGHKENSLICTSNEQAESGQWECAVESNVPI